MFNEWQKWEFAHPEAFWLLLIVPFWAAVYLWRRGYDQAPVRYALGLTKADSGAWVHAGPALIALSLLPLVTALARPQLPLSKQEISTEAIDIVLALDISSSMLAEDFKPNRLEAAKEKAKTFVRSRSADRIGLVVFAGESFTQCPITADHRVLTNLMADIESGAVKDGTAIGMGLATAVDRLKQSQAKSKVVVLLTDGVNNSGFIDPRTAAEIAREFGVRVYTIGVGSRGTAPYPVKTPMGKSYRRMEVEIDEELLQEIARQTNGRYFRATDQRSLGKIYEEIDQLEKTRINVSNITRYSEEYRPLVKLFLGMMALGLAWRYVFFRTLT